MAIKFEITKENIEILRSKRSEILYVPTDDIVGEYLSGDRDERIVASYADEDTARAEFEALKRECSTGISTGTVHQIITADVLVLWRNEYDGEDLDQGEILDSYAEPYSVGAYHEDDARKIVEDGLYDQAVNLMDDDIRERVHDALYGCDEVTFLSVYMGLHAHELHEEFQI